MSYERVLARAAGGEPLVRLAIEAGERLVYLLNPRLVDAMYRGDVDPIGFPQEDVFELDHRLSDELARAWSDRDDVQLAALWRGAIPYREKVDA